MELRVPLLEGRLLGLDAVSNGPLAYPQGTAVYLYGSSLLKYIEDRYGPDKIREISHRYGSRLIPGGLNRVSREATGRGYDQLWDDWKESLTRRYALQVEEAERRGLTPVTRLTFDGQGPREGLNPHYFHDGRGVVYQKATTREHPAYVLLDPATGQRRELMEVYGAGEAAPTPDGSALIFQRTNFRPLKRRISGASHVSWDDLFRLDLASGEVRELTRAHRVHEPDVSPDGTRIACTVGSTGRRDLAIVPIAGGAPTVLAGDLPGFVYGPSWSPDGRSIAYSRWKPGGLRDVHIYDLASGKDRALWVDRAMDVDPSFTPDGRFVVFSSDRTGIYNLFAYELATERLYQVTNLLSGAFQPTVSPDGKRVVFTGFTSDGFDVFTAAFDPDSWTLAQPFANARPDPLPVTRETLGTPIAQKDEPIVQKITDYHPWRYMYPRSWLLTFPSDPLGLGASVGLQTGFGDPVFNHAVSVNALVPTDGDASVRADYSYNGLWPSFQATLTRTALQANDLVIDGAGHAYRQHRMSASGGVGLPILRQDRLVGQSVAFLPVRAVRHGRSPAGRRSDRRDHPTAGDRPRRQHLLRAQLFEREVLALFDQRPGRPPVAGEPVGLGSQPGRQVSHRRRHGALGRVLHAALGQAARAGAALQRRRRHRRQAFVLCPGGIRRAGPASGISVSTSGRSSSMRLTKRISISLRGCSGMSMMSLRLRSGMMTRLMPARCAARNFSLMPPTGSTRPRSVISPVIATSLRIGLPVSSDAIATNMVTPADGPSLGMAPAGDVDVDVGLLEEVLVEAQPLGARADERQRRLRRLLHHVAELAGQDQLALAVHLRRLDEQDVAADRRPGQARWPRPARPCAPRPRRCASAARGTRRCARW